MSEITWVTSAEEKPRESRYHGHFKIWEPWIIQCYQARYEPSGIERLAAGKVMRTAAGQAIYAPTTGMIRHILRQNDLLPPATRKPKQRLPQATPDPRFRETRRSNLGRPLNMGAGRGINQTWTPEMQWREFNEARA